MTRKRHQQESVDKLSDILSEPLPKQTALSTQQLIAKFATQIKSRLDAGETYEEIAERFARAEIGISGATIRAYMSRARRKRSRDKRVDVPVTIQDTLTQQRRNDVTSTRAAPTGLNSSDDGFADLDDI